MELYVHLPFCKQKCRYCDFASFPGTEDRMDAYVSALLREAEMNAEEITEPIETVYFGGGAPSLLPSALLKKLLHGLHQRLPLDHVIEWTSEANPGTLTPAWLDAALEGGVNRLSIGVQAAQNRILRLMGRIHDRKDISSSVDMIRKAGFLNLSLDLIFGYPTQTASDWQETLDAAFSLAPQHLSAYGLIPEEGTPLYDDLQSGRLSLPEPEEERAMYEMLLRASDQHGFKQYEISNFALPGFACQHNIGYWTQVPYLGLGLSSASMLQITKGKDGMKYLRRTNTSRMDEYLNGIREAAPVCAENTWIFPAEARFETMMLGLRMNSGVQEQTFMDQHRITLLECYGNKLKKLQQEDLVQHIDNSWRLTRLGMDLQNTALVELMD